MTPQAGRMARQLPTLNGLRGLAAVTVFFSHTTLFGFFADERIDDWWYLVLSRTGSAALGFFFILSGFVLTWSAPDHEPNRRFWRRRAARILPNHLVVCAVFILLLILVRGGAPLWPTVANLALVQSWIPNEFIFNGVNPPSWSLSCEIFFYASFPWVLAGIRRLNATWLWSLAGGIVAAILVAPAFSLAFLPAEPTYTYADAAFPQFWFVQQFPMIRMLDFVLGIVIAQLVMRGLWIRLSLPGAALVTLAFYGLSEVVPLLYSVVAAMVIPLALLVAAAARADVEGHRSPLRGRVTGWLGDTSFAFYLLHILVLYGAANMAPNGFGVAAALGVMIGAYLVTLGLASLLHVGVERPMMRRFAKPRKPAAAPAAAATPAAEPLPVATGDGTRVT
ncbi:acyltransferase family protein [Micromonospora parva]|uniref:Acyltransferase family protein n=1 Tax=Micromonospora parva TaxID=1464048 RepID=A0ABW6VNA4_9ACTN|nr:MULTISPECIES: acyltransferase [Micromonospora]MBQ1030298.1 acyltransferase [Micromonospora sp. C97]